MIDVRRPEDYNLAGRGLELQFFATDDEIQELIDVTLPSAFAPYRGMAVVMRERGDRTGYDREHVECEVGDLIRCARSQEASQVWIGSDVVTPTLASARADAAIWSLTGLIVVEPGRIWRGAIWESRIACVPSVMNLRTGAVEQNADYKRLYDLLRAAIRKRLNWSTIRVLPSGEAQESTDFWLMTDRAAAAALSSPERWAVRPGRLVQMLNRPDT
jgi:hypothetical protein